jgi:hypothetical protein
VNPSTILTHAGETLTVRQWAARVGITTDALLYRLRSPHWTVAEALTTGRTSGGNRPRDPQSFRVRAAALGISHGALWKRETKGSVPRAPAGQCPPKVERLAPLTDYTGLDLVWGVVAGPGPRAPNGRWTWRVDCRVCGARSDVPSVSLRHKRRTSCGCVTRALRNRPPCCECGAKTADVLDGEPCCSKCQRELAAPARCRMQGCPERPSQRAAADPTLDGLCAGCRARLRGTRRAA